MPRWKPVSRQLNQYSQQAESLFSMIAKMAVSGTVVKEGG
jgi:hypothetical protein